MDDELLQDVGGSQPGRDGRSKDRQAAGQQTTGGVTTDKGSGGWSWSKRLRLQRHPSFGSVDDGGSATNDKTDTGRRDYFGVRSYLHQFYEFGRNSSGASSYCKQKYDWRSPQGQCSGLYWWKTMAMFGAGCLVIGIVTIAASFLTPPRQIVVSADANDGPARSDDATAAFDFKLEICRMLGLTMFCAGGLILAVSLMVPTFFYRTCSSTAADDISSHPVIVDAEDSDSDGDTDQAGPLPVKSVPVTETLTGVQPAPKLGESAVISDTLIPYND